MLDKLNIVKQRFDEVSDLIIQPDIISDQKRYVQINKEYKELSELMKKRKEYIALTNNISEAEEIIADGSDQEMLEMAKMELESAKERLPQLEEEIRYMLIPKDPEDAKNVVVEIRAGTGGDEASIFAGDLYRMYTKYCEGRGWSVSTVDYNEGTSGGFKEIIFEVAGEDVYGTLKFEAGVHRVQRVPQTETQGRVHTSAATVMVLPEAEEFDVELDMQDVRIERTTSTGPGGQSVNTTYVALADQDDVWLPEKLEVAYREMCSVESVKGSKCPVLVHTDLKLVGRNLEDLGAVFTQKQLINPALIKPSEIALTNVVTGCTVLCNRSLLQHALPVPALALVHDWWLALVASVFGEIHFHSSSLILYRQHGANTIGATGLGWRYWFQRLMQWILHPAKGGHTLEAIRQMDCFEQRYGICVSPLPRLICLSRWRRILWFCKTPVSDWPHKHGVLRTLALYFWLLRI